jgi:hypothetical protein
MESEEDAMVTDPLVAQIGSYFRAYGDGFHARSGAQIADFFSVPCISIRGGAAMHWLQSRAEIEKFFQGVADAYYEEGLRRSEIKNLELVPIGGRSLLASMDWVFYRGDGTLLKQWRQSYNLLRVDDRWKIVLSTFHVA